MRQELTVFLLSALPVTELRLSVPIAIGVFGFAPAKAWLIAFLGNLLPVPFLLLWMPKILALAERKMPRLHVFIDKKLRALEKDHMKSYQRFGAIALAFLVAAPLPGSGIWSVTALAVLFDIKWKYAVPAIVIGHVFASVGIVLLTIGAFHVI
jgi:uncharacterized membrane protein